MNRTFHLYAANPRDFEVASIESKRRAATTVTLKRLMLVKGMPITLAKAAAMLACSPAVTSLTADAKANTTTTDTAGATEGHGVGVSDGVPVACFIFGRSVQVTALGREEKPAAQALQKGALALEANVLAEQGVHATAPAAEYIPAGQSAHKEPYLPAPQLEQKIAPAADNLPIAQSEHVVDAGAEEYFPGVHSKQVGERSDSVKWPEAQEVQVADAGTIEYRPAPQFRQVLVSEAPIVLDAVPSAQLKHEVEPTVVW